MHGLMMDYPLLLSSVLRHAASYHGDTEIVSRTPEGGIHRYSYADLHRRSQALANALVNLGLRQGDRVGTLAWNDFRHMELYYGVSGSGFVCHTINPRLFIRQIDYIVDHGDDRVIFADPSFLPILEQLAHKLEKMVAVVLMTDEEHMAKSSALPAVMCYETFLAGGAEAFDWPVFDENTASGLCYTSGTTGDPKGVLYSHRSSVLHAMAICAPDVLGFSASDVVAPVVPMFHVNAWGFPYAAPMVGAKLVLPGPRLDPASLYSLFEAEGVTFAAGVPTVWLSLLDWTDAQHQKFAKLERVAIGGSAVPPVMVARWQDKGIKVHHAWGMTETSPVGLSATLKGKHSYLSDADKRNLQIKQGRPVFGMEFRIEGSDGSEILKDGKDIGSMKVRGPWVAKSYFNAPESAGHAADAWFDTGDVVTMDPDGFVQIVDRTKDLVKSGGEWISSIELENIAQGHPAIKEAAVVARPDKVWGERPVLVAVLMPGSEFTRGDLAPLYDGKVPKWTIPDDVYIVSELPHTATGKIAKVVIRQTVIDSEATSIPENAA
ncbi:MULTISPECIES: long-chain fatty acid--CoA ligase [Alphaproteobacteria]|uniref:Long-chain-fatty-acid--CoA ligase n=2 Tax=Alphaproteobacteria TaxID=28211 RepID=A0A512HM50_9HYPH|nr:MULTISPECIES: long-chain fatty acid--CoA ligase [Alphaproteobacteria]GEO86470.1 long-chain-fatty-acid--CoA ligase [Ciceribacter naphthalenivorans]GLR23827.1 long-chain-fatty-acid--CoA ligase [Ciceribacter naphthalenivorans]GLT06683.1 long-chain-fatty-acid--CoA ligase [Sphingomonas psychrolutea]